MTPGSLGRSTIMKSFIKQSATKTDSKVSWDVFQSSLICFVAVTIKIWKCASPSRSDLVGNCTSCLSPSVGLLLCGEYKRSESRLRSFPRQSQLCISLWLFPCFTSGHLFVLFKSLGFLFFKEINVGIQQVPFKLMKNDSEDIYNIIKHFYFKLMLFFWTLY